MARILPAGRCAGHDRMPEVQASSRQTRQRWRFGYWRHGHTDLSLAVDDEVTGEVDGDAVQGAGEPERRLVVRGHRRAGVGAAAERTWSEGEGVVTGRSVCPTRCRSM